MAKHKITVDKEACIGCGACTTVDENFEMIDGKSKPKKEVIEDAELAKAKEAEEVCPVDAIKIEEVK